MKKTQADALAWARHGRTLFDMAVAAPQVIAARSARTLQAGATPNAGDRREFVRMGQEKVEALGESAMAMGLSAWQHQQRASLAAFQTWLRWCGTPWMQAQPPGLLAWQAMQRWQQDGLRAWSGLLGHGMRPLHRRVTANAKRLSRKK